MEELRRRRFPRCKVQADVARQPSDLQVALHHDSARAQPDVVSGVPGASVQREGQLWFLISRFIYGFPLWLEMWSARYTEDLRSVWLLRKKIKGKVNSFAGCTINLTQVKTKAARCGWHLENLLLSL